MPNRNLNGWTDPLDRSTAGGRSSIDSYKPEEYLPKDYTPKQEEPKQKWWGYKHTSGTYQAKRYFSSQDTLEAHDSPFCEKVVGPFLAKDRDEALGIVREMTK